MRHARFPWWSLVDLLASRGTVLPAWWSHAQQNTNRRTLKVPALAALSEKEALGWQHAHLRWGWVAAPKPHAGQLESRLIGSHEPLLNLRGPGYAAKPPVQLRAVGEYERARAWWLFHAAWIAVLTQRPPGWTRRRWRSLVVACDEQGWPAPLGKGVERKLRVPDERAARRRLIRAAPDALHADIAHRTSANQAVAWWAAYAGHELRDGADGAEEALRSALQRAPDSHRGPPVLPTGEVWTDLLSLKLRLGPHVAH